MNKRKIKLKFWRILRWMDRKMINPTPLTDTQQMGIKIFERTVSIKDAEIFFSPLSDSIYIEVNDIYIILEGSDLQIINGKFRYDLHYQDSVRSKLVRKVLNTLEQRRIEVERRIKSKSDLTLNSIMEEIEDIRKEKGQ